MNQKEQARLSVLNSVLEYQVPIAQAAEVLGVGPHHARRLLAACRKHGTAALAHGNRGRRPHNATLPAEAAAVVELATGRYEGANHTHLTELLGEREGIGLSRSTARRILIRTAKTRPGVVSGRNWRTLATFCKGCQFRRTIAGGLLQLRPDHRTGRAVPERHQGAPDTVFTTAWPTPLHGTPVTANSYTPFALKWGMTYLPKRRSVSITSSWDMPPT